MTFRRCQGSSMFVIAWVQREKKRKRQNIEAKKKTEETRRKHIHYSKTHVSIYITHHLEPWRKEKKKIIHSPCNATHMNITKWLHLFGCCYFCGTPMTQLTMITISPCIDFTIICQCYCMTPSTCNLYLWTHRRKEKKKIKRLFLKSKSEPLVKYMYCENEKKWNKIHFHILI